MELTTLLPYLLMLLFGILCSKILVLIFQLSYKKIKDILYFNKLAKSGIKEIDKMDGLQFEFYLKALFKELGYRTTVTIGSHDFGADLIMKNDRKKIVIQAKRYGYKKKVSVNAIQQVYASKAYYKADKCLVITNSIFTKSAEQLAKACNVTLYDRYKLIELINKANPTTSPNDIINTIEPKTRKCPTCKGDLIKRKSKSGYFFGCSNYPSCNHTENIAQ